MYKLFIKLAQSSGFYTFANAIEAISPFLLAVIVTRLLEPSEYGAWVLFIALVTFLRPILNFTLQDALRMRFYDMNSIELARFVWSCFCLVTFCTFAFVVAFQLFQDELSHLLKLPISWLPPVAVTAYFFANFYFLLAYNQFADRPSHFLLLHVVQTVASISFISIFVFSGWSWSGIVIGKIIGLVMGCGLGAYWLNRELPMQAARRKPPELTQLAKFGLLYLPAGMSLAAIPLTDRIIVTQVLSLAENGFYGVAALFGVAVYVAINGILHAWTPWLFRSLNVWPAKRTEIIWVSAAYLALLPLGGLVAFLVSEFIAPVAIGDRFDSAFPLIPWAIAGTVAMGYFSHFQAFLLYKKAIWAMSTSSLLCIVANAVFSYYGAVHIGLKGVLAATIGAFLTSGLLSAGYAYFYFRNYVPGPVSEARRPRAGVDGVR